ncbi:hypothetical protein [Pseudomonas benzenivorans]|uniref:Uncharacterized protein n=1 Tax=Pseudomonas benzenivorans TaxID=556533 RepID=A0ABY5H0L3_9PSED|nr:hypothetical protein [Pseudomonas benzenivorans]UTW05790.1 hypothetical protein KDW96_11360 [Pseudomonas benzenivorans]
MAALRILFYAVIGLALSASIFVLNLLFFAKPLYALYADLLQSGQMYQGETRAFMYNRFLLTVIAPTSLLLGGGLTWLSIKLRWLAFILAALALVTILSAAIFMRFEPVVISPAPLRDHPNAQWSGGVDGGAFFEITEADPPRYFLEIRYENGSLWAKGWVNGQEQALTNSDFLGYYGGNSIDLKSNKQLRLENQDGTSIDFD